MAPGAEAKTKSKIGIEGSNLPTVSKGPKSVPIAAPSPHTAQLAGRPSRPRETLIPAGGPEQAWASKLKHPRSHARAARVLRAGDGDSCISRSSAPRLRQAGRCAGGRVSGTLDDDIAKCLTDWLAILKSI